MPNPFATLEELLLASLESYVDSAKIDKLLSNGQTMLANQELIKGALSNIIDSQKSNAADLLAIKAFLGIPDPRILATQKQLDQLGTQLVQETAAVEQFDGSMKAPVTEAPPTPITKE